MKKNCILFLLLLFFGLAGQPPSSYFGKFGGPGDDIGYSAKQTFNGNYIVAGSSTSNGNGTELYLVKIDSMAAGLWEKYYGGNGSEVGKSVIQLPDSGYVVAGFTDSFGAGGYDAYLIRVDKNGSLIWQRTFGGTDWDFANDLVLAPDGNLFVVGST